MPTHLRIVSACSESWDAMAERNGGRHCASCDKTVLDVRGLTRAEAIARAAAVKRGSVCARAEADPETHELLFAPPPEAPRPLRRLARGALLAAALVAGCDVAREPAVRQAPAAHLIPMPASKSPGLTTPPTLPTPDAGAPSATPPDAGAQHATGRHHRRGRVTSAPPVVPPQPPYEIMGDMAM